MRTTWLCLVAGALALLGCGEAVEDEPPGYSAVNYAPPAPTPLAATPTIEIPSSPPAPRHYYDERNGVIYSYIAAVSEEQRKTGQAVGNVISFAYMGEVGGRHELARVSPSGAILDRAYCSNPCKIVTYSNGRQVGFSEESIIGAAFADALGGRMAIASFMPARPVAPTPLVSPPQAAATPIEVASTEWSPAEYALIAEWHGLNESCRGGTDPDAVANACDERDNGTVTRRLAAANICYGRADQASSQSVMHRCGAGSLQFD